MEGRVVLSAPRCGFGSIPLLSDHSSSSSSRNARSRTTLSDQMRAAPEVDLPQKKVIRKHIMIEASSVKKIYEDKKVKNANKICCKMLLFCLFGESPAFHGLG